MSTNGVVSGVGVVVFGVAFCAADANAQLYADSIPMTQDVSFFGSGVLTGAPDNGGAWLSNTSDPPTNLGFIVAGFSFGLIDGPGNDLVIHDCCGGGLPTGGEFASVFVSNDGISFSFLGNYGAGVNSFDFSGVGISTINFVKIQNTSTSDSPDIDAFEGRYTPTPGALALLGIGGLASVRRRRH